MGTLSSDLLLIDVRTSWHSANHFPISTLISTVSSAFRRTRRGQRAIAASSRSHIPRSVRAPEIRRPSDRFLPGNGSVSSSPSTVSASRSVADSELEAFFELVPLRMRRELHRHEEIGQLIEVVMDLGRKPLARFPSGDWVISEEPISLEDLKHAISKVGEFSDDNRSGIDNSLHRISAIRNRKLQIIGLTCRVGRAMSGSAETFRDLVAGGGSILVVGPPGVGKTTLIREIARMLADDHKKRVVIVDTSNEIGGDGDVPHAGIGRARRMQVPNVHMQHNSVTLGDEEARKRKVQKTILERKGPSTFTCAVEMISKTECRVHHRLDASVDAILAGKSPLIEIRQMHSEVNGSPKPMLLDEKTEEEEFELTNDEELSSDVDSDDDEVNYSRSKSKKRSSKQPSSKKSIPISVYTYKILEADLLQVAAVMGLEDMIDVTDDIGVADAILACSSELKENPWIRGVAKFHQLPIFAIKSNTMAQMVKAVRMILGMESYGRKSKLPPKKYLDVEIEEDAPKRKPSLEEIDALEEVRLAIEYIVIPGGEPVELLPRRSEIVARQLELVESYQLAVENSGTELNPRLQILPLRLNKKGSKVSKPSLSILKEMTKEPLIGGGSGATVARLPLLPE
ncbi:hypothetical protein CRG98_004889 [Punica granatum]|uniref:AAA+ ATPase domain-containing protein n=1 Tax=Punica granatum TaxID=22663 RepID=A0A2I0L1H5_PUNGR|nr:hypothetical protein CRG98_004889 [Punica granatum]